MLNISAEVDTTSFDRAIENYRRFDRGTLPEIVNAKLGDWAWEAAKVVRFTTAQIVNMTPWSMRGGQRVWWRFIHTVAQSGFTIKGRRKATVAESMQGYKDPATGKWIMRRKTVSTFRRTTESLRAGDYERISRSILKRRAATVKSFVAQFLMSALMMGKRVGTVGGKNSWKYEGLIAKKALPYSVKVEAALTIPFRARTLENKRHEGDRDRRGGVKVGIALAAVNRARELVVTDMMLKTRERYARQAARGDA